MKRMKIAIYDIIHLEQVQPLISIVKFLKVPLILFTSEQFKSVIEQYDDFNASLIDTRYKSPTQNESQFIKEVKQVLRAEKVKVFILNSNDGKHLVWYHTLLSLSDLQFVLNIHEVNNLFYSRFSFGVRSIIRHLGKKLLLRIVNAFFVNTEAMKHYISEKKYNYHPYLLDSCRGISQKKYLFKLYPQSIGNCNSRHY